MREGRRNEKNDSYSLWSNVRYITRSYWGLRKRLLLLPLLNIPSNAVVGVLGILLPKLILDALQQGGSYAPMLAAILGLSLVLTAAQVIKIVLESQGHLQSMYANSFYFRRRVDEKAMDMDYENFSSPRGKILFDKAYQAIRGGFGRTLSGFVPAFANLLSNALGFVSFCVIIARLNPWIILLLALSYCVDGVLMLRVERWIQKTKNERSGIFRKLRYVAYSTRSSDIAKDIRIYSMSHWLRELGELFSKENAKWEYQVARRRLTVLCFEALLIFLRDGAAYLYLIYRTLYGQGEAAISVGDFTLYFGAIAGFGEWLSSVVSNAETITETHYALSDFRSFADYPDRQARTGKAAPSGTEQPPAIRLERVSYRYSEDGKDVLRDISFEIGSGEKIAVVGVNGAGKTTLVKLICGLLTPTQGTIYLNGIPAEEYGREERYRLFTAVFQDISLLPASIAKNVSFRSAAGMDEARLRHCLALAGLTEKIESLPKGVETTLVANVLQDAVTLSGGEMQRLLLARAVYCGAPVMILDEPTAALDPIAENEIYLKYNEITQGKSAIYISHRLSSTRFCDRILLLDGAGIAEQGTHAELMDLGGKYAELFTVQSHYYQENLEREAAGI